MKLLFIIVLVLVVVWVWRSGRRGAPRENAGPGPSAGTPHDMFRCPVCEVHLPRAEGLPGANGLLYCSHEHRLREGG